MGESLAGLFAGILELAVVGVGGLAWVGLVILGVTGQPLDSVTIGLPDQVTTVAVLALVYVLGVVIDRSADTVLDLIAPDPEVGAGEEPHESEENRRAREDKYRIARMQMAQSPELFARSEYIRTRLRVVRGWTLNAVLLAPAWALYAARNLDQHRIASLVSGTLACLALTAGCYLSWLQLRNTDRKQIELFRTHRHTILGGVTRQDRTDGQR